MKKRGGKKRVVLILARKGNVLVGKKANRQDIQTALKMARLPLLSKKQTTFWADNPEAILPFLSAKTASLLFSMEERIGKPLDVSGAMAVARAMGY